MNAITNNASLLLKIIGWTNLSLLLVVSPLYTSKALQGVQPTLFSDAGIFTIALWGLVYLAVAQDPPRYARLLSILALEKAFYAATGFAWLADHGHTLSALAAQDTIAGLFYAGYGLWDGTCAVLLFVLWRHFSSGRHGARPAAANAHGDDAG